MPRVSALIEEKGFDLMGLEEVCTPQADYLRRTFPGWGLVGVATNDAERARTSHANGVFFRKDRFEVEEWGWFGLSETPDVPGVKSWGTMCVRACTWARMKDLADGGRFMIFNTHFDHRSQLAREKGMELILSEIEARNTGRLPVVLLGDFNSVPSSPQVLAAMKKLSWAYKISGTPPKGPYRTDNSWKFVPPEKENAEAGNRIDLIFLTPGTKVFSHETFGDFYGDGLYPSDHFPVKAVIEFKVSK
jgi:endonuclease/exonuclease/phosphatase family metal-dependent hydrolase